MVGNIVLFDVGFDGGEVVNFGFIGCVVLENGWEVGDLLVCEFCVGYDGCD